ncbi:N-acetylmuramoyl-L-alanine amidase [Faunimonas pinastri]|uniref:N-acetylmuramoyl-L-alanine amidase n=1 Tax=Faunimonas pinastri TaxID=1855383 RepID=A0A1H9FSM9_9HYPH|nr:N-acetylmuramoyl-L-alanine amidase [Faunimonas pinastri]SEQ40920.1 N-acetylmuramoyl-L-alanine amidase [Faunimonas pinastri]
MTSPLPIEDCPSPNHGERRTGPVDILILHYTGMPDDGEAQRWLCNPESEVSSHYVVHRDGRLVRLVPEDRRAWHAGASSWAGETDINSRSVGIEIANPGHTGGLPEFPPAQIEALIALCREIVGRHPIPPHRVLAHSDVAPSRKVDPGERFPWDLLHEAGIGHWVEPVETSGGMFFSRGDQGQPVEALQAMLALYGYGLSINGVFDKATEEIVSAFQRHFRPARVDGIADRGTIETLHKLLVGVS